MANFRGCQTYNSIVGRRTTVVYPDATTDVTAYDAVGCMTSKTDQAGKVTQYGYDSLGRLTSVTQSPDGGVTQYVTSYGYDELGNRVSGRVAHTLQYLDSGVPHTFRVLCEMCGNT